MGLLEVENLTIHYKTARGPVRAVEEASFKIEKGEAMGLAGESGCGKTTIALTLMGILPPAGKIVNGRILFNGRDIASLKEAEMRKLRWRKMSIVFQGAMNALNPVFRVGDQIVEAIRTHERDVSPKDASERTARLLELVGIDPKRGDNYPHEFSGGMRQRALIAMALALNPDLLIADEPGTALDVIVQAQILRLLRELKERLHVSMILITHDLSIIAETCDKAAIMYAGRLAEIGSVSDIFRDPLHPYTKGLMGAFPGIHGPRTRLMSIPGQPPDLLDPPTGCPFHPRCAYAMEVCKGMFPSASTTGNGHQVACYLYPR